MDIKVGMRFKRESVHGTRTFTVTRVDPYTVWYDWKSDRFFPWQDKNHGSCDLESFIRWIKYENIIFLGYGSNKEFIASARRNK